MTGMPSAVAEASAQSLNGPVKRALRPEIFSRVMGNEGMYWGTLRVTGYPLTSLAHAPLL